MGITGLLPFLKKASRPAHLRDFKGQTVAIDAYCWLHKGAFSCADKLVRGEPTDGYIIYVMRLINLFLNHDIKPILVFDGCHLPSKAITETKRRENRERNRKKAKELLREGRIKEAKECFQRCVDITSEMASEVINACRARNVDIIVAPYEADAQLAYLNLSGVAQFVVTEDSDLVLFGCKHVLFKMDHQGGGILVEQEKLHQAMGVPRDRFCFDKFRNMCILSGCDYLPSLHGIGLAKACKFFNITSNPNLHNALCKLPAYLKMPQLEVTQEYRDGFIKARNTFLYQLVFDPMERMLKPLTEYPDGMEAGDYPYAGKFIGHDRALQIALGNVNVQSGETVDNFDPECFEPPEMKSSSWGMKGDICSNHPSIWKPNFTPKQPQPAVPDIMASDRKTTKGKEITVSNIPLKRKRIQVSDENASPSISDGDLQNMYGISEKKLKVETDSIVETSDKEDEEGEEQQDESFNALDLLSDGLDAENSFNGEAVQEESLQEEPPPSLPAERQRSKNPFSKVQSPKKKSSLPAGEFSALKRFSAIRKTVVDTDTIVQSRYFASPQTPKPKTKVEESPDKKSPLEMLDKCDSDTEHNVVVAIEDKEQIKRLSKDSISKSPLSPVQTNSPVQVKKPENDKLKRGTLTKLFSFKSDPNFEINCSPSVRRPFKSVLPSKSIPAASSRYFKENGMASSEDVDDPDSPPPSQMSCSSEVSCLSRVGSIDNESFDLTPSQTPTSSQNSFEGDDEKNIQQKDMKTSPAFPKSPPFQNQKPLVKCRPVGLSKSRGGKTLKQSDPKQRSLRDMFSFKKEKPIAMTSRPSL